MNKFSTSRREFLAKAAAGTGFMAASGLGVAPLTGSANAATTPAQALEKAALARRQTGEKTRMALVGTGVRGIRMFGRDLLNNYGDYVDLVGICDQNPGRLAYAREFIGHEGPAFTNLEEMLKQTRPEWLIVTTWDWEHHSCIITGLEHGCNIICEKPLTIDEHKAEMILQAEKKYGKQIVVTFNYRWPPHRAKLKELIMSGAIGDLVSVDFHWHIRHGHLQQYMMRWHGERNRGGTLWVHKATHHFDMANWWIDSDPVEVFAKADLEHFGLKGPFRGLNCRNCAHTEKCDYHWDIMSNNQMRRMYADNEHYDGYIRDNCVFRPQIDIYDKHSALVTYANNVYMNYSLTANSDFEGYWITFNGTKGRIEGKEGGWHSSRQAQQWHMQVRGQRAEVIEVPFSPGGHWGGDPLLTDVLFKDMDTPDPLHQVAGTRDGIMSVLVGVAADKSALSGKPVRIGDLTSLTPQAVRPRA